MENMKKSKQPPTEILDYPKRLSKPRKNNKRDRDKTRETESVCLYDGTLHTTSGGEYK